MKGELKEKGISTAAGELLLLAMSIVVVSSAGLLWLHFALPSQKVKLEIVGGDRSIGIYDVGGTLDCRRVKILFQDHENLMIIEKFEFNGSQFVGSLKGWKSNPVQTFLNPGECVIFSEIDPGIYLITISDDRGILAQSYVKVS